MFVMEQIALSSHIREHINIINVELDSEEHTHEEFQILIKKLNDYNELLDSCLSMRRMMMEEIHNEFK